VGMDALLQVTRDLRTATRRKEAAWRKVDASKPLPLDREPSPRDPEHMREFADATTEERRLAALLIDTIRARQA
jgi:hypothetical protein